MDLFLIDLILKGKVKGHSKVLDVGCGEGKNGLYFIRQKYEYHGWDIDSSKIKLLEYFSENIERVQAYFKTKNVRTAVEKPTFDYL